MCGIAGIVAQGPITPSDTRALRSMANALTHRGPDDKGLFFSATSEGRGQTALAIRRLSIIDLTAGIQPLFNEERSVALVANGEIYNYLELRGELQQRGHTFRTGSDCEVIVHLYEEMGEACLSRLRGMFAIALYDERRRRLLLARDRLGEKPLYLHRGSRALYFASEAKAFVRAGIVPFEMDESAILQYLHWGFVTEPQSAIRGVTKLRAGHFLSVALDTLALEEKRYWDPRSLAANAGDSWQQLRGEIDDVARLVIRSDVPVGVCLSAGVDSSAVAALAARQYPGTITGVTVGFSGTARQDEREGARRFAKHLGIPLIEVELTPEEAARVLPEVCAASDEPINDIAGSSIYCMMSRCRAEGLKVMLSGLGGDELFWGYPWLRRALMLTERKRMRLAGEATLSDYVALSAPTLSYNHMANWIADRGGLRSALRRFREDPLYPPRMIFWDETPGFADALLRVPGMIEEDCMRRAGAETAFSPFSSDSWPERLDLEFVCLMLETYLREIGLGQSDRLSSANSVEMRTPFADYRFVELAIGMQLTESQHRAHPKAALVSALGDLLPTWVTKRKKTGFSSPWRAWTAEFARRYGLLLVDGVLVQRGILRADKAAEVCARLAPGYLGQYDSLAQGILRLELWARGFQALAVAETDQSADRVELMAVP